MEENPTFNSGMWFEEFEPGQQMVTMGRTVNESDLVDFAELTGDFNPVHLDQAYAEKSPFGRRVAHGLLVMSIAVGMLIKTGIVDGTIDAFRGIKRWKFKRPVYIGDTVRAKLTVQETNRIRGLESGIILFGVKVINQLEELVMSGQISVLVRSRFG